MTDEDVVRLPALGQTLGLDEGEGHFPVQQGVLGQEDPLLAALSKKVLDFIAAVGKRDGLLSWR